MSKTSFTIVALLIFGPAGCSASPGPIAFVSDKSGSQEVASIRYATGPPPNTTGAGRKYGIATLDESGVLLKSTPAILFQDDAMMPGCNAGFDSKAGRYIKTTIKKITEVPADPLSEMCKACPNGTKCCRDPTVPADQGACFAVTDCSALVVGTGQGGDILTIDAQTGAVTNNVTMTGDIAHPPFGAWDATKELLYSVVPYSYTEAGLFSFSPSSGIVKKLTTWHKEQFDGVGLCEGLVMGNGEYLIYQFGGKENYLTVVDLQSMQVVNRVQGFFGPLLVDPLHPDRLIAIQNQHRNGIAVMWVDPLSNSTTQIFHLANTTLGSDLRAQDQGSIAVDSKGLALWFVASYNVKNGSLYRGIFTLHLASDRTGATLKSQREAFGDDKGIWLGRLDHLQSMGKQSMASIMI